MPKKKVFSLDFLGHPLKQYTHLLVLKKSVFPIYIDDYNKPTTKKEKNHKIIKPKPNSIPKIFLNKFIKTKDSRNLGTKEAFGFFLFFPFFISFHKI